MCQFLEESKVASMANLLSEQKVTELLSSLPGWTMEGKEIVKEYRFGKYLDGIAFAGKLGAMAEAANHHPDMLIRWRKVEVRLSTHSAGGLTELDFALAKQAEEIAKG